MSDLNCQHTLCTKCASKRFETRSFVAGDIVIVNGLKNKTQWNHNKALIMQYVAQKDRYAAKLLFLHSNMKQTVLLKPENLTFASKQKYIRHLEGKITTNMDHNHAQFKWEIPKKQLQIYATLGKDCGFFSPIFEYKEMLFIFQLLPNGFCRLDQNFLGCYKSKNNQLFIAPTDNNGHVSLILTLLSAPFHAEHVELDYSIQINSIPSTYNRHTQVFHNHKLQDIWESIMTTATLKTLDTLTITATFKDVSIKIKNDIYTIRKCNDMLHFSWSSDVDLILKQFACKTHKLQELNSPVFVHHDGWQWQMKIVHSTDPKLNANGRMILCLELKTLPAYIHRANVRAVVKCSQLNVGCVFTHTFRKGDEMLAVAAEFCTFTYLQNNAYIKKNKKLTVECTLHIAECVDIDGNFVYLESGAYIKPKMNGARYIISRWMRDFAPFDAMDSHYLQCVIVDYLLVPNDLKNRFMHFQNDEELKFILNRWPKAKCVAAELLEEEEAKPFKTRMASNLIEQIWLATFEDTSTSALEFNKRKRGSVIFWGCRKPDGKIRFMPEIALPDICTMTSAVGTDCVQFQMVKQGDWALIPLTISYFSPRSRHRDIGTFEMALRYSGGYTAYVTAKSTEIPQKPIRYRVWNALIMQYEDVDVTDAITRDDYWNTVEKQLEAVYIKISVTKMFAPVM